MKPVLLLVDLQNDFLNAPELQPSAGQIIDRAAFLLNACRDQRLPVIHIWTTVNRATDERLPHWRAADRWMCVEGSEGHATPEVLRPRENELIIHKTGFNAFTGGVLESNLRELKCDCLIVGGVHLHACVRTVAAEALERQLTVVVADDAVGSNDPMHAAATRRWLAERCVRFQPAASVIRSLDAGVKALSHTSPRALSEVLFEVPIAGDREIATAVSAAQSEARTWQTRSLAERSIPLLRLAELLENAAPELALQMALEIGKPVKHGREELFRAAESIRDVVRRAAALKTVDEGAGLVRHQPVGVVALISPWNNPAAIPLGKIAPALAYGNTVVWKPAPAATGVARSLLRLLSEAGISEDAVRLVTGDHTTAQKLAAHLDVQAVTFTGSLAGGYAMQEICSRRMVPFQAELSGNNAAIVWDDADLSEAASQAAWGAFAFAGQRCTANRRVIVSETIYDRFLNELIVAGNKLNCGDPVHDKTEMGPVISAGKRDEIHALLARAQNTGAAHRVETLRAQPGLGDWARVGAYVWPKIVCCDRPEAEIAQEESMAPILVVQRAHDFDQALTLCNGVRHGLIAALFSESPELQRRFLSEARAGVLKLNSSTAGVDVRLPFGGWKASGVGPPEHGIGDVAFYTRMQALYQVGHLPEFK